MYEDQKKRSQQQTTHFGGHCFPCVERTPCYEMIQKQTDSATVRGPPGPTIVIYKELIRVQSCYPRATPFSSRQRAHIRYGFLPHLVGGNDIVKSLMFSPYPAIPPYVVRTPHPGMTADPAHQI